MKILWVRILIAAFVLETLYALFVFLVLGAAEEAYTVAGLVSVFVFMLLGGVWVGRNAASHSILQGGLVGVAAVLLYTLLTLPAMIAGEFAVTGLVLLNHLLKILGASSGGAISLALPKPSIGA